jgi:hypothetical protein
VVWQAKLKEMEARLKSKEATMYEADGVAAKVARDRQGNFVFQFDKNRYASLPALASHASAESLPEPLLGMRHLQQLLGAAMLLSGHDGHFPDAQYVLVGISENMHSTSPRSMVLEGDCVDSVTLSAYIDQWRHQLSVTAAYAPQESLYLELLLHVTGAARSK